MKTRDIETKYSSIPFKQTFQTNPNNVTNLSKLFQLHCSCIAFFCTFLGVSELLSGGGVVVTQQYVTGTLVALEPYKNRFGIETGEVTVIIATDAGTVLTSTINITIGGVDGATTIGNDKIISAVKTVAVEAPWVHNLDFFCRFMEFLFDPNNKPQCLRVAQLFNRDWKSHINGPSDIKLQLPVSLKDWKEFNGPIAEICWNLRKCSKSCQLWFDTWTGLGRNFQSDSLEQKPIRECYNGKKPLETTCLGVWDAIKDVDAKLVQLHGQTSSTAELFCDASQQMATDRMTNLKSKGGNVWRVAHNDTGGISASILNELTVEQLKVILRHVLQPGISVSRFSKRSEKENEIKRLLTAKYGKRITVVSFRIFNLI